MGVGAIPQAMSLPQSRAMVPALDRQLREYRAIAAQWGAALRLGGALLFEVGIGQAGDVGAILAQNQFEQIQTFQDTQGIGRVVEGVLNS